MLPHPLAILSVDEVNAARDVILAKHKDGDKVIDFREIYLEEPPKAELVKFLELEHNGSLSDSSSRPSRTALVQYDVIDTSGVPKHHESCIDLQAKQELKHEIVASEHHACLTLFEFDNLLEACKKSRIFQDAIKEFSIPEGFELVVEPWPYGGPDPTDEHKRYFQGLCFAQDKRNGNPDSNYYAYPIPLIPIMDAQKKEIIKVERLATGGKEDGLGEGLRKNNMTEHCRSAEYIPELLEGGTRKDLKPLNVSQPDGPSFKVTDGSLVEWQKWRFRVGFNAREGATLHDIHFDGRSVMYRLGMSEMTVPYADPRHPFQRKQAFDFGDGGAGNCANNLELGCDCVGVIKYFNATKIGRDGTAKEHPNIVCLHEQDNGIGWKHTSWRTGRPVVTRNRELVVQFIITLANYEYVFAYIFDQAGGITVEVRATGVVSVVSIDPGKTSDYGNIVSPGVLAQNHQHIFCVRMDPAIDGHQNSIVCEESRPEPMSATINPSGNFYRIIRDTISTSSAIDANPLANRVIKMINPSITNPISGNPVGYKFVPSPTQLLLADPESIQSKRASFAQHHIWITKHRDQELFAAGRYTLQSRKEVGGVADAISRNENVENEDVVVWHTFGLTHNPRVEDWPVMPVEIHQIHIRPVDFFTANPALDVPSNRNLTSKLAEDVCCNGSKTNGVAHE